MAEPSDNDDADMDDIAEMGSWVCHNACGAGGRCTPGDEWGLELIHLSQGCPNA